MQRPIPDLLKLAIAQKIEDNLFSKVGISVRQLFSRFGLL
jgi:hypothetical protein